MAEEIEVRSPTVVLHELPAPQTEEASQQSPPAFDWDAAQRRRVGLAQGIQNVEDQRTAATQAEIDFVRQGGERREQLSQGVLQAEQQMSADARAGPEPTQFPEAPGGPLVDPEQFKSFFGPMFIFSLLLGKVAKADMVDGLNMLSSGINGYVQGSQERFKHGVEVWKNKTETALASERQKLAKYKGILESDKYNIQSKQQLLEIEAQRQEDHRMLFALQNKNWDAIVKNYITQEQMLQKQEDSALKFYQHTQDALQRQKMQDERLQHQKDMAAQKAGYADSTALTPETAKRVAQQVLGGDRQAMQGYARNPKNQAMIQNAITEEMYLQHMSGRDLAARMAEYEALRSGMRAAGTRGAQIGFAAHELDEFTRIALAASAKVPRAEFVPINQLMQMGTSKWSPEQAAFVAANRSVINAFAQLASRGVPTVHNTEEAEKMLYTAQTPEQYKAVSDQLIREAEGATRAANAVLHNLSESIRHGTGPEQNVPRGGTTQQNSGTTQRKPGASLPHPKTPEEADKLPPGTHFIAPDGKEKIR